MKMSDVGLSPKYVQLYGLQALEKKLLDWRPYKTALRGLSLIYSKRVKNIPSSELGNFTSKITYLLS